jgi:hypothetical protein
VRRLRQFGLCRDSVVFLSASRFIVERMDDARNSIPTPAAASLRLLQNAICNSKLMRKGPISDCQYKTFSTRPKVTAVRVIHRRVILTPRHQGSMHTEMCKLFHSTGQAARRRIADRDESLRVHEAFERSGTRVAGTPAQATAKSTLTHPSLLRAIRYRTFSQRWAFWPRMRCTTVRLR